MEIMEYTDTIAAIATAMGNSGIGIVRISGENAVEVAEKVFRAPGKKKLSEAASHTIHYGYVYDGDETIDEVLLMLMRGPRSFFSQINPVLPFKGIGTAGSISHRRRPSST